MSLTLHVVSQVKISYESLRPWWLFIFRCHLLLILQLNFQVRIENTNPPPNPLVRVQRVLIVWSPTVLLYAIILLCRKTKCIWKHDLLHVHGIWWTLHCRIFSYLPLCQSYHYWKLWRAWTTLWSMSYQHLHHLPSLHNWLGSNRHFKVAESSEVHPVTLKLNPWTLEAPVGHRVGKLEPLFFQNKII